MKNIPELSSKLREMCVNFSDEDKPFYSSTIIVRLIIHKKLFFECTKLLLKHYLLNNPGALCIQNMILEHIFYAPEAPEAFKYASGYAPEKTAPGA